MQNAPASLQSLPTRVSQVSNSLILNLRGSRNYKPNRECKHLHLKREFQTENSEAPSLCFRTTMGFVRQSIKFWIVRNQILFELEINVMTTGWSFFQQGWWESNWLGNWTEDKSMSKLLFFWTRWNHGPNIHHPLGHQEYMIRENHQVHPKSGRCNPTQG